MSKQLESKLRNAEYDPETLVAINTCVFFDTESGVKYKVDLTDFTLDIVGFVKNPSYLMEVAVLRGLNIPKSQSTDHSKNPIRKVFDSPPYAKSLIKTGNILANSYESSESNFSEWYESIDLALVEKLPTEIVSNLFTAQDKYFEKYSKVDRVKLILFSKLEEPTIFRYVSNISWYTSLLERTKECKVLFGPRSIFPSRTNAYYNPDSNFILLPTDNYRNKEDLAHTVLHEMTHIFVRLEGSTQREFHAEPFKISLLYGDFRYGLLSAEESVEILDTLKDQSNDYMDQTYLWERELVRPKVKLGKAKEKLITRTAMEKKAEKPYSEILKSVSGIKKIATKVFPSLEKVFKNRKRLHVEFPKINLIFKLENENLSQAKEEVQNQVTRMLEVVRGLFPVLFDSELINQSTFSESEFIQFLKGEIEEYWRFRSWDYVIKYRENRKFVNIDLALCFHDESLKVNNRYGLMFKLYQSLGGDLPVTDQIGPKSIERITEQFNQLVNDRLVEYHFRCDKETKYALHISNVPYTQYDNDDLVEYSSTTLNLKNVNDAVLYKVNDTKEIYSLIAENQPFFFETREYFDWQNPKYGWDVSNTYLDYNGLVLNDIYYKVTSRSVNYGALRSDFINPFVGFNIENINTKWELDEDSLVAALSDLLASVNADLGWDVLSLQSGIFQSVDVLSFVRRHIDKSLINPKVFISKEELTTFVESHSDFTLPWINHSTRSLIGESKIGKSILVGGEDYSIRISEFTTELDDIMYSISKGIPFLVILSGNISTDDIIWGKKDSEKYFKALLFDGERLFVQPLYNLSEGIKLTDLLQATDTSLPLFAAKHLVVSEYTTDREVARPNYAKSSILDVLDINSSVVDLLELENIGTFGSNREYNLLKVPQVKAFTILNNLDCVPDFDTVNQLEIYEPFLVAVYDENVGFFRYIYNDLKEIKEVSYTFAWWLLSL